MGNARTVLLIITISMLVFTNYAQAETDYAALFKFRVRTTSDWTHIQITGLGTPQHWNYTVNPSDLNAILCNEDNYTSIWIGKPPLDESLTEVEIELVSLNPSDIKINISKGYLGFTSVKTSIWNRENFREINRISHTTTLGDPSYNRFSTTLSRDEYTQYSTPMLSPQVKQEKPVLAVYYPWYGSVDDAGVGRHWGLANETDIEFTLNYPLLGAYDSQDVSLISEHIKLASENGIDGFAVSWWGKDTYEDQAFKKILEPSDGFKACLYYETNRAGPPISPEMVASELNYVIENYGYHENYLRVNKKPVILIFNADGQGRDRGFWTNVRSHIMDCVLVGDFRNPALLDVFDGVHIYNELDPQTYGQLTHWISEQNKISPYNSISEFKKMSRDSFMIYNDKLTIGTVSPGFDDTKIRLNGTIAPRQGVETYQRSWDMILSYDLDWVLITSWNEWHEGTEIEPSRENGYTALNETRIQVEKFRTG